MQPALGSLRFASIPAAVLLLALASAAPATAGLTFTCDPAGCVFADADTMDVYVGVDGSVADLQGFSLLLEYDPAVITPVAAEMAGLTTGSCFFSFFPTLAGSTIALDGAGLGCSVDGPGELVRIRFVGVNIGISPLSCLQSILRDSQNQPIDHTCAGTSIEYTRSTPVQRTTWTCIKSRY